MNGQLSGFTAAQKTALGLNSNGRWTLYTLMRVNMAYIQSECKDKWKYDTARKVETVFGGLENPYTTTKIVWGLRGGSSKRKFEDSVGRGRNKKYLYVMLLPWNGGKKLSDGKIKNILLGKDKDGNGQKWDNKGYLRGYFYYDSLPEASQPTAPNGVAYKYLTQD